MHYYFTISYWKHKNQIAAPKESIGRKFLAYLAGQLMHINNPSSKTGGTSRLEEASYTGKL
jgi:hypothetical protein